MLFGEEKLCVFVISKWKLVVRGLVLCLICIEYENNSFKIVWDLYFMGKIEIGEIVY